MAIIDYKRRIEKFTKVEGAVATIPPGNDHDEGGWVDTDIYEGEIYLNLADELLFVRNGSKIIKLNFDVLPYTYRQTAADIRTVEIHHDNAVIGCFDTGVIYLYDSTESSADDGDSYLKPNNVTGNGRWVKKIDYPVEGNVMHLTGNETADGEKTFIKDIFANRRLRKTKGTTTASATDMDLPSDGNSFQITGTTPIERINNTNWRSGDTFILEFSSDNTLVNGVASGGDYAGLLLPNAQNLSVKAGDIFLCWYNGANIKTLSGGGGKDIGVVTVGNSGVDGVDGDHSTFKDAFTANARYIIQVGGTTEASSATSIPSKVLIVNAGGYTSTFNACYWDLVGVDMVCLGVKFVINNLGAANAFFDRPENLLIDQQSIINNTTGKLLRLVSGKYCYINNSKVKLANTSGVIDVPLSTIPYFVVNNCEVEGLAGGSCDADFNIITNSNIIGEIDIRLSIAMTDCQITATGTLRIANGEEVRLKGIKALSYTPFPDTSGVCTVNFSDCYFKALTWNRAGCVATGDALRITDAFSPTNGTFRFSKSTFAAVTIGASCLESSLENNCKFTGAVIINANNFDLIQPRTPTNTDVTINGDDCKIEGKIGNTNGGSAKVVLNGDNNEVYGKMEDDVEDNGSGNNYDYLLF